MYPASIVKVCAVQKGDFMEKDCWQGKSKYAPLEKITKIHAIWDKLAHQRKRELFAVFFSKMHECNINKFE